MRPRFVFAAFAAFLFSLNISEAAPTDEVGVHCRIDAVAFDGDPELTRIDYLIPPGGKPARFRLLAMHSNDVAGSISVQLKTYGTVDVGSTPLSLEPLWKSVVQMPKQSDSAVASGDATFTHFEPHGDLYAAGTMQFTTADGHRGDCRFRLVMQVVDLGNGIPR